MRLLDLMVCFVQQFAHRGCDIVSGDPLEVEAPEDLVDEFAEVVTFLRESFEMAGKAGLVDKALHRLCYRRKYRQRGHIDWENAFPKEWAFTEHEERLLSERLGLPVWVHLDCVLEGRLEGVRPGWCFITPGKYRPIYGNPRVQFLQRTESALPFSSLMVERREILNALSPNPTTRINKETPNAK
jgi:hypothetical protein